MKKDITTNIVLKYIGIMMVLTALFAVLGGK